MAFEFAARLDELPSGTMRGVVVDGQKVLLIHVDGMIAAFEDRCAHMGVPLSNGFLEARSLVCFMHGWEYDALTGQGINDPNACLQSFAVRVDEDGSIWVSVDGGE
jgi:toluene monooxygenase system ferredoxin subunit